MNNIQFLFILSVGFSSQVLAATTNEPKSTTQQSIVKSCNPDEAVGSSLSPSVLEKNVEEALKAIKAKSPQVHEDSLRVFKNFKSHSKPVHWTYRSWGRSLILWLRDEKDMAFNTREKVGKVFMVLWHKQLISESAVMLLTNDAWSHLVYLEGVPSWEKNMEEKAHRGGKEVVGSNRIVNDRAA
ncbi:MAG: hypothetical protein K2Y18_08325 [Alphaproteobacteria bacterium]|jgi:hypothetical protein|nr:hypothetical protein [Alphaproteobacteria bacterium]